MKVRNKVSWPCQHVIPGDPNAMMLEDRIDKVHKFVGHVKAVKVSDLEAWCRDNPDVTAVQLADMFSRGEFD